MTPAALEWVARFRRYMTSERRLSAHTDRSYSRDLTALVSFCDRSGVADWDRLDPDQMARLLEIPPGDALTARDRAIMELLYSSGLRLAELVGLDIASLDLRDRTVQVLGKGRKARIVPVGRAAARALKAWLPER